jgi:hypothetical protein
MAAINLVYGPILPAAQVEGLYTSAYHGGSQETNQAE